MCEMKDTKYWFADADARMVDTDEQYYNDKKYIANKLITPFILN